MRPRGQRCSNTLQRFGRHRFAMVKPLRRNAPHASFGQRACLVDEQRVHAGQALNRIQTAQQHAASPHGTGGREQRAGRGQRQRTGAGHDQHRHDDPHRARRVDQAPGRARRSGEQQHGPQERRGPSVGARKQCGALRAGRTHQRHDGLVAGVSTHAVDPHEHRRMKVHAARHHSVASPFRHRLRLACQQRFVGLCRTLDQHAVGSERLANRDAHPVASTQPLRADHLHRAIEREAQHRVGQACRRVFERLLGAVPRAHLQVTPAQQEADEHRQRIEVDLGTEQAAGVEGGTAAGDESHRDAQGHRHVHADAPVPQRAPRTGEERCGRKPQHRQAQQPAAPVEQTLQVGCQFTGRAHVSRCGEHHDLHRAKRGHEQAPQRCSRFPLAQVPCGGECVGHRLVACRLDGPNQR